MHTFVLVMLGMLGLPGPSGELIPGRSGIAGGDSLPVALLNDANRLLRMAGVIFSDKETDAEAVEALLKHLDSLHVPGDSGHHPGGSADDGLIAAFDSSARAFGDLAAGGMPRDTVRSAFRELFFAFHHAHREQLRQAILGDIGVKLLLFSASLTCDCTRKLSDSYIGQIVQAKDLVVEFPPILVLDYAVEPDLMDEYGIGILPTVVILDGANRETARFQGTEFILPGLVEHLQPAGRDNEK